jgi:hypothetical protein
MFVACYVTKHKLYLITYLEIDIKYRTYEKDVHCRNMEVRQLI